MKPLITISFPVYEGDDYVADSLKSVLAQDYENLEILIIDDCGQTHAMQIVQKTLATIPHKHAVRMLRHPRNLGVGMIRNTSIDQARGEYIYFIDSDDRITPDCISKLYHEVEVSTDIDYVAGSRRWVMTNGTCVRKDQYPERISFKGDYPINFMYARRISFPSYMTNYLFRLDFLRCKNIRCIHPKIEDSIFTFDVMIQARSGVLLPDLTYDYLQQPHSIIHQIKKKEATESLVCIIESLTQHKYERLATWENKTTRNLALLTAIKIALSYLCKFSYSTSLSKKRYQEAGKTLLGYPKLSMRKVRFLTWRERARCVYYNSLRILPLPLRLAVVERLHFPAYGRS